MAKNVVAPPAWVSDSHPIPHHCTEDVSTLDQVLSLRGELRPLVVAVGIVVVLTEPAQPVAGHLVGGGGPLVRHVQPHRPLQPPGDGDGALVEEGEVVLVVAGLCLGLVLVDFIMKPGLHTLVDSFTLEL